MPETQAREGAERSGKLYTLTEVSEKTGISMPTLQRYKKQFQSRLPSVGKGRRQRYLEAALPVFKQIKEENIARRGRPRKSEGKKAGKRTPPPKKKGSARRPRATAKKAEKGQDLLTLTETAKRAGISYPTAVRYVKTHAADIPHEGKGRRRRFYPAAVEVMKRLRKESSRGRKATAAGKKPSVRGRGRGKVKAKAADASAGLPTSAEKRIKALEKSYAQLEKQLSSLLAKLRKPRRVI